MADTNNDKAYKAALKQIDDMLKKQQALGKSTEALSNSWKSIASEIFKMDGAEFFKNIEKSPDQLAAMGEEVQNLQDSFKSLGDNFTKSLTDDKKFQSTKDKLMQIGKGYQDFSDSIAATSKNNSNLIYKDLSDNLKNILENEKDIEKILKESGKLNKEEVENLKKIQEFQKLEEKFEKEKLEFQKKLNIELEALKESNKEISLLSDEAVSNVMSQIAAGKDLNEILASANDEERKFLALISETPEKLKEISKGMSQAASGVEQIKKQAGEMNKTFSLSQSGLAALKSMASGLGSIIKRDWVGSMTKFDDVLNNIQKETSINMDLNKTGFAELQTEVAQFGVSVEQAGKMMADMSKELNTTNFSVLSNAAKDFAAIEGATGAASGDITNIAGELMRMGESSGQVKDFMEGADQEARKFGVSSSKILGSISKNMSKMRKMGFIGGEESLKKMSIQAERLHLNVDSIFDMAEHARSIEGAMEMASELQLAGGSFSNINPMDLLAAARKGPAELQKILTKMGSDIGKFNEKGEYEFDPIDADRLKIAADAAHVPVEEFQKMISQNAIDSAKLNPFQGTLDGIQEADKDLAKSTLSDMLKRGKDGTISVDVDNDMAKKMGITELAQITPEIMQKILEGKKGDAKTLEEQNKRNQSLKQSFDNFINSLMSIFSFFQPALEVLTEIMQGVTSVFTTVMGFLPGWSKALLGGLIIFGTMFSTSVGAFVTQGIGGFIKGVGSFAKSALDLTKQVLTGGGKEAMGGLMNKIKGKFTGPQGATEAGLNKGGEIANQKGMTPQAGAGIKGFFTGLSEGIQSFGKVKAADLIKFAASLLIIGGAIIGFGMAMAQVGGEAGAAQMVTAAVSLGLLMGAIFILSKIAGQVDMGGVLKGALAMLVVGASILPFAFAAQMLTDVDWMSVLAGIGVLGLVVLGLMGLGALMAGPQIVFLLIGVGILIAVGAALLIAAAGLLLAAQAFQQLGAVDWGAFSGMGDALLSVVPGLLAFSFAAMMFMNPLTLLGIIFMVGALASLVSVMAPLAQSLTIGADSLDRFASGLEKLSAAADALSLEKLEKLKELSDAMANASAGGGVMAAMANMANSSGGGAGGGDGEVRKIEVNVKMNGRELQNYIVKDTAIVK